MIFSTIFFVIFTPGYRLQIELENQKTINEKLESDKDKRIEVLENKLELMAEFLSQAR